MTAGEHHPHLCESVQVTSMGQLVVAQRWWACCPNHVLQSPVGCEHSYYCPNCGEGRTVMPDPCTVQPDSRVDEYIRAGEVYRFSSAADLIRHLHRREAEQEEGSQ